MTRPGRSLAGMNSLVDFEGLRLETVGGDLRIMANANLRSLRGLETVARVGGDVEVEYNEIPDAEIAAFLARLQRGGP